MYFGPTVIVLLLLFSEVPVVVAATRTWITAKVANKSINKSFNYTSFHLTVEINFAFALVLLYSLCSVIGYQCLHHGINQ